MKYLFTAIWLFALKPVICLLLCAAHFSLCALIFIISLLWDFDLRKALDDADIVWGSQDEEVKIGEQYWYYATPYHHMYDKKKWRTGKKAA